MSRSTKKAIVTISRKMADNAHGAARSKVRARLDQIDPNEPDEITLLDIEADTKEMGLEDYGTRMGLEFTDDEYWQEDKVLMSRK